MNKDTINGAAKQFEGEVQQTGGKIREAIGGDQVQSKKDQVAGATKKAEGAIQESYGKVKDAVSGN